MYHTWMLWVIWFFRKNVSLRWATLEWMESDDFEAKWLSCSKPKVCNFFILKSPFLQDLQVSIKHGYSLKIFATKNQVKIRISETQMFFLWSLSLGISMETPSLKLHQNDVVTLRARHESKSSLREMEKWTRWGWTLLHQLGLHLQVNRNMLHIVRTWPTTCILYCITRYNCTCVLDDVWVHIFWIGNRPMLGFIDRESIFFIPLLFLLFQAQTCSCSVGLCV